MRENTEWIETVKQGVNILVGIEPKKIVLAINHFQPDDSLFNKSLFGDGKTSSKIVEIIMIQ